MLSSLPPLLKNPKVTSLLTSLLPEKLLCSDLLALNCFGIGAGAHFEVTFFLHDRPG